MQGRSRIKGLASWGGLAALALVLTACAGDLSWPTDMPQNALDPAGPFAREADDLWNTVFPIAVIVFILVQGGLLYIVFRFRVKKDDDPKAIPPQVAGNTQLEMIWTIIPVLILAAIGVPMIATIFTQAEEPPEAERVDVTVVGKQYWWQFEYPEAGVFTANELHIPIDTPIYVHLDGEPTYTLDDGSEATDEHLVLHSFWVPRLAGKLDYVPGHDRFMTLQADEPGRYLGQCAEFCGLSHANMKFAVVAHDPDDYEAWLASQSEPSDGAVPESGSVAARGADVFATQCVQCHAIDGNDGSVGARVGPDLSHFGSREVFGGGMFDNDDTDQLRAWLRDAPAEKPGSQMPSFPNLSEEDLDGLVEYLRSLR